jgi:hypothetical protein
LLQIKAQCRHLIPLHLDGATPKLEEAAPAYAGVEWFSRPAVQGSEISLDRNQPGRRSQVEATRRPTKVILMVLYID